MTSSRRFENKNAKITTALIIAQKHLCCLVNLFNRNADIVDIFLAENYVKCIVNDICTIRGVYKVFLGEIMMPCMHARMTDFHCQCQNLLEEVVAVLPKPPNSPVDAGVEVDVPKVGFAAAVPPKLNAISTNFMESQRGGPLFLSSFKSLPQLHWYLSTYSVARSRLFHVLTEDRP